MMRKWLLLLLVFIPARAWSQAAALGDASVYTGVAQSHTGAPAANATIRVCTSAASGVPCAPLAPIYTDFSTLIPQSNPFVGDNLGNFTFYANPGKYVIQVSGTGISTYSYYTVLGITSFGYWVTPGDGLSVDITAGRVFCNGTMQSYAGGTVSLTANATNYVYLSGSGTCAPAASTTPFSVSTIPLNIVVTGNNNIASVSPARTYFVSQGAGVSTFCQDLNFGTAGTPMTARTYLFPNCNYQFFDASPDQFNSTGPEGDRGFIPLIEINSMNTGTGDTINLYSYAHYNSPTVGTVSSHNVVAAFIGAELEGSDQHAGVWGLNTFVRAANTGRDHFITGYESDFFNEVGDSGGLPLTTDTKWGIESVNNGTYPSTAAFIATHVFAQWHVGFFVVSALDHAFLCGSPLRNLTSFTGDCLHASAQNQATVSDNFGSIPIFTADSAVWTGAQNFPQDFQAQVKAGTGISPSTWIDYTFQGQGCLSPLRCSEFSISNNGVYIPRGINNEQEGAGTSGFQHDQAAIPSIGASSSDTVTMTWATPFLTDIYTATCTTVDATGSLQVVAITARVMASVTVKIQNTDSGSAHTGELDCTGVHLGF